MSPNQHLNEPVTIKVSAMQLAWPACCACCLAPQETVVPAMTRKVKGRQTMDRFWDVPYCQVCDNHVIANREVEKLEGQIGEAASRIVLTFLLALVAAAVTGLPFYLLYSYRIEIFRSCFFGLFVAVSGGFAFWVILRIGICGWFLVTIRWKREAAEEMLTRQCCGLPHAVQYLQQHGSLHVFAFANKEYARMFADLNRKKIIH